MDKNNTNMKLQDNPDILAYQFHQPLKSKDDTVVETKSGHPVVFGSTIYLGLAATSKGLTLSDVNHMVDERKAICFLNGKVNVWKPTTSTHTDESRVVG